MSIRDEIKRHRIINPIRGHDVMDAQRFADDTRHMLVFDVYYIFIFNGVKYFIKQYHNSCFEKGLPK